MTIPIHAFPEALTNPAVPNKPWTKIEVQPVDAKVNLSACIAMLPLNVDEYTDLIHWHEMGHGRYDGVPSIFGNTEPGQFDHILGEPALNARLVKDHGVNVAKAMRALDFSKQSMPTNARDAALLWINLAFYLQDEDNTALREFAASLEEMIDVAGVTGRYARMPSLALAVKKVMAKPADTVVRQTWAVKLAELFTPTPPPPTITAPPSEETAEAVADAREAEAEKEELASAKREEETKRIELGEVGGSIGRCQIHEHISLARPGRRITAPGRAIEIGSVPEYFHRYCSDQMLFKARKTTGSIVIDCSGSMEWDWDALRVGLREFPNVVVACYTGLPNDKDGRLCIIARKGRWSDYQPELEFPDGYGNNTVDYEALTWLARQPKPRLWLSDGEICGGNPKLNNAAEVKLLMSRGKILRVATLPSAIQYFKGHSVPVFDTVSVFQDYTAKPRIARKK